MIANQHLQKTNKSNLIYDTNHNFYKYRGIKRNENLSIFWPICLMIYIKLVSSNLKEEKQKRGKKVYNAALESYNNLLGTYLDEYYALSDAKRSKINPHMLLLI